MGNLVLIRGRLREIYMFLVGECKRVLRPFFVEFLSPLTVINYVDGPGQWGQCITVHQRTVRYPLVRYSALFLYTFSVSHCGNLHFFMLHSFHFACSFVLNSFHVALFSFCNLVMFHFFHAASFQCFIFLCINLFMLHFSCCIHFIFALIHIALLHAATSSFCFLLLLQMLQSVPAALCSCCTVSISEV